MNLLETIVGGILPGMRRPERDVHVVDGTTYRIDIAWLWCGFRFEVHTPRIPRKIRRQREAARNRDRETVRRHLAGEPLVQVGDLIPKWADAFLAQVGECRDSEFTVWKRAVGDERYAVEDDGTINRSQEYDWIAFLAGEWGGGWTTTEGLLDYAPITVMKIAENAAR